MSYYAVLGVATFLFLLLGLAIWAKTRSIAFVVGLAFAYYWTLWGGWFVVYDLNGGNSGLLYDYRVRAAVLVLVRVPHTAGCLRR